MRPLTFRAPSDPNFTPPTLEFLTGPWHVTHSTLPMWKSNRNVVITYTPLPDSTGSIDDLVEYKPLDLEKQKTVRGIDKPHPSIPGAYNWRGKGLLKIASSQWETLGYGEEDGGWVVTFFQKTLFTPAGIDVYARVKGGLSTILLEMIKKEMERLEDLKMKELVKSIFEVKHDW